MATIRPYPYINVDRYPRDGSEDPHLVRRENYVYCFLDFADPVGDPDPFLMRCRELRKDTVSALVIQGMNKQKASEFIRKQAKVFISKEENVRFIEAVETELMSLHKGSIARYRLRPIEFDQWYQGWH